MIFIAVTATKQRKAESEAVQQYRRKIPIHTPKLLHYNIGLKKSSTRQKNHHHQQYVQPDHRQHSLISTKHSLIVELLWRKPELLPRGNVVRERHSPDQNRCGYQGSRRRRNLRVEVDVLAKGSRRGTPNKVQKRTLNRLTLPFCKLYGKLISLRAGRVAWKCELAS